MFFLKKTIDGFSRKSFDLFKYNFYWRLKEDKTNKFRNNYILNHNILNSAILVIKHFSPFISDCLLQVLKILYQIWFVRIW